ncbi:hypothetical protein F2P79_011307 [Pimephales promelas]|nr:hypothetical protein F2P79_011307 [Pimephales promelas]
MRELRRIIIMSGPKKKPQAPTHRRGTVVRGQADTHAPNECSLTSSFPIHFCCLEKRSNNILLNFLHALQKKESRNEKRVSPPPQFEGCMVLMGALLSGLRLSKVPAVVV